MALMTILGLARRVVAGVARVIDALVGRADAGRQWRQERIKTSLARADRRDALCEAMFAAVVSGEEPAAADPLSAQA